MTIAHEAGPLSRRLHDAYARLARYAHDRAARHQRLRTLKEIQNLPYEIRRDIGYRD